MSFTPKLLHTGHVGFPRIWVIASLTAVGLLVALPISAQAASSPVPLGTADSFAVLAGAGITNTGPTTLNGDLGTFPTTTITGAGSMTVNGTNHHGDAVTQGAKTDLVTAYNNTAGQGPTSPIAGDLAGKTLKAGVYNSSSSIGLTGELTLDGAGDSGSVWVFQAGSSLTTGSGSQITLINGAQSCNVFWQIGTSATLGTGSEFVGTLMAKTSVSATTGASVVGRLLARNGAATLDTNTITKPSCAATGSQVRRVPSGAVASGDGSTTGGGSTSGGNHGQVLMAGGLVFAGLGAAAVVAERRRRRLNA